MMKVSELASLANVTQDAVRHYVRIGLLTPLRDETNGYKLFSEQDLQLVRFIGQAKRLGFSLQEIKQIFQQSGQGASPCPMVRELLQQRITENQQKIAELTALQARMEQALGQWQSMPDGTPDGHSVCCLIESLGEPL